MLCKCLAIVTCVLPCSSGVTDPESEELLRATQSQLQQVKWLQQQANVEEKKDVEREKATPQKSTSRSLTNKDREPVSFLGTDSKPRPSDKQGAGDPHFITEQKAHDWYLSNLHISSSLFQRQLEAIERLWSSPASKYGPYNANSLHPRPSLDFPTKPTVLFFTILWFFVLALTWASPIPVKFKRFHGDRVMSTLHSMIASAAGISLWLSETPQCSFAHPQTHWIRLMMLVSVGYFITDICSMVYVDVWKRWRNVDLPMLLHHCFVIGTYSWTAENNVVLWFAASLLVNAMSVGPLNTVHWLRYSGLQDSVLYKAAGTVLVVVFFWSRIVLIPWSVWLFRQQGYCYQELAWVSNAALMSYAVVYILNVWWFIRIGRAVAKALRDKTSRKKPSRHKNAYQQGETSKSVRRNQFLDPDFSQPEDPQSRTDPSGGD